MRTESDFIGSVEIDDESLYGIHSLRAARNFPDSTRFHCEWFRAAGSVKKACMIAYGKYAKAVREKHGDKQLPVPLIDDKVINALAEAAGEIESGRHFDYFIVPAIQGGAGTSINMNVNEIIANRALVITGHKPGEYNHIDPIEQANLFQSTNDVIPTSLKVALLRLLPSLETAINNLRASVENQEKGTRHHLRIAYTQMQEAVPSSYGRLFSTYSDALSRDWWRVSKCFERIKTVNLGGSAIGTGITVPRYFMKEVVSTLQQITGLPVTRSENLQDATCNLDSLVEIHAVIKAHAVNLEKIVSDLRLLSSDLMKNREMVIPQLQVGSSIMPGKVNPVVPEFVVSVAHKIYSNDILITGLCGLGCLDLNAYLPLIGHALIESIKLLIAADESLNNNLMKGLQLIHGQAKNHIVNSPSVTTALLPYIGYHKSGLLAKEMKEKNISLFEANEILGILTAKEISRILEPENLLREGYTLNEIIGDHG